MTQMIALRRLRYAGKLIRPGVRFDISKKQDVRILSALGSAKELVPEPVRVTQSASQSVSPADRLTGGLADRLTGRLAEEDPTAPDQKPTRRYKRRDMKAEDV